MIKTVVRFLWLFEPQRRTKDNKRLRYYRDFDSGSNQRLMVSSVIYLIGKKSRHKISSVKKFVTGKIIRHFLRANFFAWLSENN